MHFVSAERSGTLRGRINREAMMEADTQSLSSWIVLKVFIAFFLTSFGLAMVIGRSNTAAFLGAFFASIGLTYLTLLWIYSHRVAG